ncbi:L-type lectin-domain containing receptor kinase IV.1-like [Corylus avellana]|uniref:L-type lectin-domain containing receptor kinase IV.1-like n=1 Tax=Corylus avellana TaxID=13451 RepID=UPI001E223C91|nr:L-type lectin-domain containing receptor kinase IV.1-like [Corylus avellana]XP_059463472.1 L-type lectin-domain containing receptor kinase IV.1-like [Corylus avellana]
MHSIAMFMSKLVLLLSLLISFVSSEDTSFTFDGFKSANLSLDGIAEITSTGLLKLTNNTNFQMGQAFYPNPISFRNSSNGAVSSFSTTFVFAIVSEDAALSGYGLAFVIAPTRGLPAGILSKFLGLFNTTSFVNPKNQLVGVELDTTKNPEIDDINDNHVGIDINGLQSERSATAGYYADDNGGFRTLSLKSGQQMQVWLEYDGVQKQINVTLAPLDVGKPKIPLLSLSRDLSPIIGNNMYVGFSSATGETLANHYVLAWSFKMNGQAPELLLSQVQLPPILVGIERSKFLTIGLPVIIVSLASVAISGVIYVIRRKRKFEELLEDWELDYGPQRFKYKDLFVATKGFREKEQLGKGGFGKVYRGVLPTSKIEIAVKRISHESRQGMKEFVAEIASMGRLRHRNLVPLLGYCRRKKELLLVYDFMPSGSLDKYLFYQPTLTLCWSQRFRVIKGVASGLFYLHEEWEQVVVHRDVKASNVLLDGELNARLGDFGLARFYDRGTDPQTTHVVGTIGYIAPELTRSGKATTSTDVFAFGAFLLEVACGRRPIEPRWRTEDAILVDWVFSQLNRGEILGARDPNLGADYVAEEVELVLKLGLLCSHSEPAARPSMRQVVQFLEGGIPLPELPSVGLYASGLTFAMSYPVAPMDNAFTPLSSIADSLLLEGR